MWIDVSVPLNERLPIWPGSPGFELSPLRSIACGDTDNVTRLTCDLHTGTHIDAPKHVLDNAPCIDSLDLDVLIGRAYVAEIDNQDCITPALLDASTVPAGTRRLLLKTSNSDLWTKSPGRFDSSYCALTSDAALWVVDRGIRLIGIDYLSLQRYGDGPETHRILLKAGVIVVEGLDLSRAHSGPCEMICLPLKLEGIEAAPARVVIRYPQDSPPQLQQTGLL